MTSLFGITGAIGSGKSTVAAFLAACEPSHAVYESGQLVAELANQFNHALASELSFELQSNDTELVNQVLLWFAEAISEQLHQPVTWNQLAITKHRLATQPELYEKLFAYMQQAKATPEMLKTPITQENKSTYRLLLQWLGGYLVATASKTIWFAELLRRSGLHDADKRLVIISGLRYPSDADIIAAHSGQIIEVVRPGLAADTRDGTEAARIDIQPTVIVTNNGNLAQLQTIVEQLWFDHGAGQLQHHYKAA